MSVARQSTTVNEANKTKMTKATANNCCRNVKNENIRQTSK
jgi:hypothetical protein